ncbi:hypothetical protein GCM10009850_032460 [Nonomuraea monospora]|uniref:Uncharacterized protein n=1 Tax=Nonomuraea monospora TaxID=568818 RepID=A0ABN3CFA0_9ACTN
MGEVCGVREVSRGVARDGHNAPQTGVPGPGGRPESAAQDGGSGRSRARNGTLREGGGPVGERAVEVIFREIVKYR